MMTIKRYRHDSSSTWYCDADEVAAAIRQRDERIAELEDKLSYQQREVFSLFSKYDSENKSFRAALAKIMKHQETIAGQHYPDSPFQKTGAWCIANKALQELPA